MSISKKFKTFHSISASKGDKLKLSVKKDLKVSKNLKVKNYVKGGKGIKLCQFDKFAKQQENAKM